MKAYLLADKETGKTSCELTAKEGAKLHYIKNENIPLLSRFIGVFLTPELASFCNEDYPQELWEVEGICTGIIPRNYFCTLFTEATVRKQVILPLITSKQRQAIRKKIEKILCEDYRVFYMDYFDIYALKQTPIKSFLIGTSLLIQEEIMKGGKDACIYS